MRITLLVAYISACLAAPAVAQPMPEKASSEPTKMVCKKFEATGTRLKNRRVCATTVEWAQREAQDKQTMRSLQQRGRIGTCEGMKSSALAIMLRGPGC